MASTRNGVLAIIAASLVASAGVLAFVKPPEKAVAAEAGLPLDAPLPTVVPPGAKLVIGDPLTQRVLEHTGWIKDLPFKVEWAQISGGPAVTEAFHAKVLDVGSVANIPPIHATWVGIPVKAIGLRFRRDPLAHPTFVLATAPKSGIRSPADLRGKRIAFSAGQAQGEIVLRTLEQQGIPVSAVKLVELPSTSGDLYINALVGGMIDAAPISAGAPAKRYLEQYGAEGGRVMSHGKFRDDLGIIYVRTETLHDPAKAAALREYVKIWGRANEWIATHPKEWAKIYYEQHQGLSPDDAAYVVRTTGEPDIPAEWTDAVTLQQASIDLMAKQSGRKPFDAAILFDRRFEHIAAEAVAQYRAGLAPHLAQASKDPTP
ncbi:ABC transporter substrate-binding protein [Phenylobacterium sp.]|uniref:ABC transporter substrate-binding protein n=1 Tax=Phenylobacterium sp. TaxID=1871053 RepID=UPI0027372A6F|nr:ABC transporter substrate-binding protein [Phenylobacterium sp.]MDP3659231.1 ABC transporter substrate-binding protein [Phenylobacterium sp.]